MSNETSKHGYFGPDLQEEIKELLNNIPKHFVELGRKLNRVQSSDDYDLGRVRKNVNKDKSTLYGLITIYKTFFQYLDQPSRSRYSTVEDWKEEIGWSKWILLSRYLRACTELIPEDREMSNFVNITFLMNKGKNLTKRELGDELEDFKQDPDPAAIEKVILPGHTVSSIRLLWRLYARDIMGTNNSKHWKLKCPGCGRYSFFTLEKPLPDGVIRFSCSKGGCEYSCLVMHRL